MNGNVKEDLLNLLQEQGLNETANNVNNTQKTKLICWYGDIIKTQNEKVIGYTGNREQLLKKFKDTQHFFDNVGQSRSTVYCKISL